MKVLLAHPGTQYAFHLAKQLAQKNLLYQFRTGLGFTSDSLLSTVISKLPGRSKEKLQTRLVPGLQNQQLKTNMLPELMGFYQLKKGEHPEQVYYKRNRKFQLDIPGKAIAATDVVIGFDTSSWILIDRCRQAGKKFILDVSIAHPLSKEKIYKELALGFPAWKEQATPKDVTLVALEQQEIAGADKIVVPSEFVKATYVEQGVPEYKIVVNQFGTDVQQFIPKAARIATGHTVFLFFGGFTARKGLPFLLNAWQSLNAGNKATLLIAGFGEIPNGVQLPDGVKNLGIIAKDKRQWLFGQADVMVFPSYFEGLAQVQIEAAACGLPVIGTFNSGATEVVKNGESGFIIETGNQQQLEKAIQFFIDQPAIAFSMGQKARKSAEALSWDAYGNRWEQIIRDTLL